VETINDQYMVAGGLPERFAGHATEICLMALDLRNAVTDLRLPSKAKTSSDHVLQLKIGIHTGQFDLDFKHSYHIEATIKQIVVLSLPLPFFGFIVAFFLPAFILYLFPFFFVIFV